MKGTVMRETIRTVSVIALGILMFAAGRIEAQLSAQTHKPSQGLHHHDDSPDAEVGIWEGSPEGKAYSEFNHHLAGIFVVLIGLSELRPAMGIRALAWTRLLLPVAMLATGMFLLIWSDHDAWPIGSLSFAQTFLMGDWETVQHKLFGTLLLLIGGIEWLRRTGRLNHLWWRIPLPGFAIIGGLSLFMHSHGAHPSAHKIALHHTIMGIMAVAAGSSKLLSRQGTNKQASRLRWELIWAVFVLLIGFQLLIYTE